jgi:prolyl-tRNA synthetase
MRAREFLMKDAYSFHLTQESLQETYDLMYATYSRIFDRSGLTYRAVEADTGNIGGSISHEFHVLADSGEDRIVYTENGKYAANIEMVPAHDTDLTRLSAQQTMQSVDTPDQHSIEEVSNFLNIPAALCLKTLIVKGTNDQLVALVLRGDHELNRIKAEKLDEVAIPLEFANADMIKKMVGCSIGSIGPVNLALPIIADHSAVQVSDFACGANQEGKHLTGVNWGCDLPEPKEADLRLVVEGEPAPDGSGPLKFAQGIEVGHIFQLGTKYSAAMKATCLDENSESRTLIMGCYGIGVSRIVAAAIEQNHDDRGIIWPVAIAPFQAILIPINMHKSQRLRKTVMQLYDQLQEAGIEVLLDDRKERPGVMFADAELIGIPHRLTFSESGLDNGMIEYKSRSSGEEMEISLSDVMDFIKSRL